MAQNVELITLGSKKLANETSECIPVAHKNMLTVDQLHDYYRQIPNSNFFAVLVFDSSNSILMLILTGIEQRKDQLIGIFICTNSDDTSNYPTTNIHVYRISKTLIAYKINSTISRFLECECIKQFERYRLESGMALEEQRRHLMEHLGTNKQFKACHILLTPLNTTPKALHTAKQRLKNICYNLYGGEYTFRIHTLYNYIPEDESNPENSNYEDYLKKYYGDDICCSIMDLSVMVFCLVGNLSTIDNQWSQKLIASHVDTNENRLAEYFGKLTFIIDQPVPNQYYQDLLPRFGATWQIPSAIPTLLDNLKDDIAFQTVLQSISGILENREMAANYKIKQRSLNISNHMVAFSSNEHLIQQAQRSREENEIVGDIENHFYLTMTEIEPKVIILANIDTFESFEILLPIPLLIVYNEHSLITKISNRSNQLNSSLQRFFIICLKTIETDEDEIYNKIEENPEVLAVFHIWNDESMPILKYTKVYYIQKELITIAVTCKTIEFLKNEADIQTKLNQLTLTKLYMRKAEKIKEWLMSNMRAEPCHILLIPLNTDVSNLLDCIQYLKQHCTSLGYPSTSIRILDEYIPKSELYNKLPYGKTIFEYEHPEVICAWLRDLSPIRMYLYGNEQLIASEWSKQMILYEADHIGREIVNDDDWHTFIENDAIDDDIKWNFYANHAQTWKIKRMTPIKVCNLNENLRFRSALRRAHITYHTRKSTVTAQIYHWFDQCSQFNYIPHEFQLQRHNRLKPRLKSTNAVQISIPLSEFNNNVQLKLSPSIYEKDKTLYSLPYLFNQTCEYIAYNSSPSDQTYIWLDDVLYSIEERFHGVIHPNQWIHFTKVNECQEFIQNKQLQYNSDIYLIAKDSLAEQLFTFDHVSRISSAYIYSDQDNLFIKWIRSFQVIKGVYANFDELYDKLCVDMVRSMKRNSCPYQEQEYERISPISFFELVGEGLQRYRVLTDLLLKLPRKSDAKRELIDELRRTSNEINLSTDTIDDFERNYSSDAAIQWYTRESFVYRLINCVLRSDNLDWIIKFRLLITDLYEALAELHKQIDSDSYLMQTTTTFYRGQLLSSNELKQLKQNIGCYISINAFFSTSLSLDIALSFVGGYALEDGTGFKPVLFSIEVDPRVKDTRPFAEIKSYSNYKDEDEVLFALGSIFRIEKIDMLSVNDNILVIHLKLIDENELPQTSLDILKYISDQQLSEPIYAFLGLTSLFQTDEQSKRIKSIFEEADVRFFHDTEDFEHYTKSSQVIQSFVILISNQAYIPAQYQQTTCLSYAENDTHFNDLIYQLISEMEKNGKLQELVKDLHMKLANLYCPSNNNIFYVQLLLSSTSKKDCENELKTKFSSSSIVPFYQIESCISFLRSLEQSSKLSNAVLILQSDDENLDNLIDQLERINSIKYIYLCSKNALNVKPRRILYGQFLNEHDLYTQLYSDHLFNAFTQTNHQIDVYKDKKEATRYFEQTEEFHQLLQEHLKQEETLSD